MTAVFYFINRGERKVIDRVTIGDRVRFKDFREVIREGKVVGHEVVEDPRRQRGEHFLIATPDMEAVDVHASRVIAVTV